LGTIAAAISTAAAPRPLAEQADRQVRHLRLRPYPVECRDETTGQALDIESIR
jgi:hypothetical protein